MPRNKEKQQSNNIIKPPETRLFLRLFGTKIAKDKRAKKTEKMPILHKGYN